MSPNFVCQRSFFTLAMQGRLLTNFLLRHFHALLGPTLKRLAAQMPHLLDEPLLRGVGLVEVAFGVLHRGDDRREPVAKVGMLT